MTAVLAGLPAWLVALAIVAFASVASVAVTSGSVQASLGWAFVPSFAGEAERYSSASAVGPVTCAVAEGYLEPPPAVVARLVGLVLAAEPCAGPSVGSSAGHSSVPAAFAAFYAALPPSAAESCRDAYHSTSAVASVFVPLGVWA